MQSIKFIKGYKKHAVNLYNLFNCLYEVYIQNVNYTTLKLLQRYLFELRKDDYIDHDLFLKCTRTINKLLLELNPPKKRAEIKFNVKIEPYSFNTQIVFNELNERYKRVKLLYSEGVPPKIIDQYIKNREKTIPILNRIGTLMDTEQYQYLYGNMPKQLSLWGKVDPRQ